MGAKGSVIVWFALAVLVFLVLLQDCGVRSAATGPECVQKGMCLSCHMIDDRGGQNAPDLSHVGKKYASVLGGKEQARNFFRNHLTDPKQFPGNENGKHWPSNMPPFKGVFTDGEFECLIEYLLSLQ